MTPNPPQALMKFVGNCPVPCPVWRILQIHLGILNLETSKLLMDLRLKKKQKEASQFSNQLMKMHKEKKSQEFWAYKEQNYQNV